MAFIMTKKKKYKFSVECCVEELTEVPFVSAVMFAKVRLMDGTFQEHSTREEVKNHTVRWNALFQFVCKMTANASTGVLEPSVLRISIRIECKGGRSYQKLGFVDVNLAELAGAGEASWRYLLEGYDARRRQDNSTLRIRIKMNMLSGDPLFKVPSPSLKHKQISEHLNVNDADAALPESADQVPQPPASLISDQLTNSGDAKDDCGSSIASGSSGFGSLPKKRPALFGSELLNHQSQTTIISTDLQLPQQTPDLSGSEQNVCNPLRNSDEFETGGAGGTLQRQRSGSDMLDGIGPSGNTHCPVCLQGHTHSRNSSNTSGDMSSKASGYGSSLSQQSQHSRQSSEGGDSSESSRHPQLTSSVHVRKKGPKLLIVDRHKCKNHSADNSGSDVYVTPNSTFGGSPDLIPKLDRELRSPGSDSSAFMTPEATMISPISGSGNHKFATPSYFDRKKQDVISLAKSAVNVLPLSNFHLFKQKSLNTIPDTVEKEIQHQNQRQSYQDAKEKKGGNELFSNFPFLTPLANRKNSIIDRHRLSSCTEDDFYDSPDQDFNLHFLADKEIDGRHTISDSKSFMNQYFLKSEDHFKHSTPKSEALQPKKPDPKPSLYVKAINATNGLRYSGAATRTSKSDGPKKEPCGVPVLRNPGGGGVVMTETGSLDRAKAALERRKHKSGPGALGIMTLSAGPEVDTGHTVSGRVENTRVNPDSLIDELLKATNLDHVEDNAETSGLQLFIAKDGTAALGSRQIKSQMSQGVGVFKQVVMEAPAPDTR